MKTATWTPPAPTSAPTAPEFFAARNEFVFIDDKGKGFDMSYFTVLYATVVSLRAGLACVVTYHGAELYAFDGNTVNPKGDFAAALIDFEYFLLKERTLGYGDAITSMEGAVEESKRAADLAAGASAAQDGPGASTRAE